MSWIKLFVLSFVVVIAACKSERETSRELSYSAPNPGFSTRYLIEPGSLLSIIDHDSVVIIDMREPAEYRKYHLPGALNIWRSDIENDSLPYQGVLASRSKMESLLGSLGIRNGDYIVIYDDKALCDAARLCWVLDYYGYQNVTLLHGGIKRWQKSGQVTKVIAQREKTRFTFPDSAPSRDYANLIEMKTAYIDSGIRLIYCRSENEFSGSIIKPGAFAKRRIPGSVNVDWIETMNLEAQTFKPREEIAFLYKSKGVDSTSKIFVYCHTGVRSAHTTLVLSQILQFKHVRNFDGSWAGVELSQSPSSTG